MRWLIPLLQLLVASASVFNVIRFRLDNLLIERAAELDRLTLAGLAVTAVSTTAVLALCWRVTALTLPRAGLSLVLIGVTALSGVMPGIIESRVRAVEHATRIAEQQQRDDAFARELIQWTADVDRRAAAAQPLEPEQAWAFLDCIASAGYRYEGADPPSARAIELLRRALAAGLIDVNALVPGHHVKEPVARPLFLQFYKERVEPLRNALARQDWEIMRLLAAGGADLSLPDAAPLAADLAKTVVAGPSRFVSLK
ncbi:hypothetical protein NLM33_03990 [Bradyrhizobium sp. CCGUVB1N3]|uniref:hypothetical protein n=1 Tax=Bradyrhizobium sp. CCGUVB1N3 TaxID=2949629 RepID=UPI0020B328E2|nr:hypothetical protein [Bradyrhizobium sp. CCGUVB1N3]MCP3469488.1 hypothetical protein [Bradyrhizobium sp. CCGUVB1N3]